VTTTVAFDYTSRDYPSIRQDMLNQIPLKVPEWTDLSVNDFGVAILELFAYQGDIMSYYGDRIANEAYLQTATQRANVLTIAKMLDYIPGGNIASQVALNVVNGSGTTQVIPAGTQVTTATGDVTFETLSALTLTNATNGNVTAAQGLTVSGEALGQSDGSLNQDFTLFQNPVIDGSVKVFVNAGSGAVQWTYIEHLIDGTPSSQNYTLYTDASNVVHVVFGDGTNGAVPPTSSAITVTYRVGGGTSGNVGANTLVRFATSVAAGVTVTNQSAAAGGGDLETLDSIRANAPRSLFSLNRAVTNADYSQLALRVNGVAKANAVSAVYSSVTIFIAPVGGGGLLPDGVTATTQFANTQTAVQNYFVGKAPNSTTVTVSNPAYVPITVTLSVQVLPNYSQDTVRQGVISALNSYLSFDNVSFAQRLTLSDIYSILMNVPGVQYGTHLRLLEDRFGRRRRSASGQRTRHLRG
jgi:hypothetical protein